jgi:hypothetical protein
MFCRPRISIYACNETNLMHYLPSVYSVTISLYVSGLVVAHHQEVTMYVYVRQLVGVVYSHWVWYPQETGKANKNLSELNV